MITPQFGSFELRSPVMKNIINNLQLKRDKKIFLIVGEIGSGRSTMARYINQLIFDSTQVNIFEDVIPASISEMNSGIITATKENAYEIIKKTKQASLHIVEMPSLSERKADISVFAQFFLEVLSLMSNKPIFKLSEKTIEKLIQHSWPGNFHELESVLEEAFENAQSQGKFFIEPEHVQLKLSPQDLEFTIGQKLDEVERKYILQTLYFVHQNRTKAAEILGISIRTLRNKINQYREEGYL